MAGFGEQESKNKKKIKPVPKSQVSGNTLHTRAVNNHLRGDLENAEKDYRELIKTGYSHSAIFSNLGVICKNSGRLQEAIFFYKRAVEIRPNEPEAYTNLGITHCNLGNFEDAVAFSSKSVELKPNNPEALTTLGWSYRQLGNLNQALASTLKSLELKSDNPTALMNLGSIHQDLGNFDQALKSTLKSLELKPDNATALMNLGTIYKNLGNLEQALTSTLKSLEPKPNYPKAHMNLGVIYQELGNLDQALNSTLKSLELQPDNPEACMNIGNIYKELGNLDQALTAYNTSLHLRTNNPEAQKNLSVTELLIGNYKSGWQRYEYRFQCKKSKNILSANPSCEKWNGNNIKDATQLLVIGEQGLGDNIQFMRYIKILKDQGISTKFCAQPKLHDVIKASGIDSSPLTLQQANQIDHEKWIPLLSIPKYLEVSPTNPLATDPYIKPTDELANKWQSLLSKEQRPIIGINWNGNRKDRAKNSRNIPIQYFEKIAKTNDATFVSLQRGSNDSDIKTICTNPKTFKLQAEITRISDSDRSEDFSEYAAIIANCDLVITTATTVAHIAGGIGIPTWVLLEKIPDWRWGLEGESSFWYPSVKLFRQKQRGKWEDPLMQLSEELNDYIQNLRPFH